MTNESSEEIQQWLQERIAQLLDIPKNDVDIDEQLISLGLTSVQTIALTTDLESFLSQQIDPVLIWEHPTIRRLANHLYQVNTTIKSQGQTNQPPKNFVQNME